MLLSLCQALTSNSSLPHSCWAICSGDQSHTHTCCKCHSALTWHSCQRKGGVSVAAPTHYRDFPVTQIQGERAAEILLRVRKPTPETFQHPDILAIVGPQSQTPQNLSFQYTMWFLLWRSSISYLKPFAVLQSLISISAHQAFPAIILASSQIQAHMDKLHLVRSDTNIQITWNSTVLSTQHVSN